MTIREVQLTKKLKPVGYVPDCDDCPWAGLIYAGAESESEGLEAAKAALQAHWLTCAATAVDRALTRSSAAGGILPGLHGGASSHHPDTAKANAVDPVQMAKWGHHRWQLLQQFAAAGDAGLTDEAAGVAAELWAKRSRFDARCSEMRSHGLIEPSGETRLSKAGVWCEVCTITRQGREALRWAGEKHYSDTKTNESKRGHR